MTEKPYACDPSHGKYDGDMSEKVTDADRDAAEVFRSEYNKGPRSFDAMLAEHFASHRIAAAKAERERCVKVVKTLAEILTDRQWDEDLDETAVPTGGVSCRYCEGGCGPKSKATPKHEKNCQLAKALELADELAKEGE